MKISIDEKIKKEYNITLNYNEMYSIYHALDVYFNIVDSILSENIGLYITTGENSIKENCRAIFNAFGGMEPDLCKDESFLTDVTERYTFNMPFGETE